jgi:hypothetical protein
MATHAEVSKKYTHGNLIEAIRAGIATLGKTTGSITVMLGVGEDLASLFKLSLVDLTASEALLQYFHCL